MQHGPGPGAMRLHPADNVLVALKPIAAGTMIASLPIKAGQDIAPGHKLAAAPIASGEAVLKYGQVIGVATARIAAGEHVHVHNLAMSKERAAVPPGRWSPPSGPPRSFMGFRRPDGRVGTRNYLCVLTSVNCSGTVARIVAEQAERRGILERFPHIDGIIAITHGSGCGMAGSGEGYDILRRTLWGTAMNPNVGAVLLIGLGCEVVQPEALARDSGLIDRPGFDMLTIQEAGGTAAAVDQALARLEPLAAFADRARRTKAPASALVLGLQCGGSDGWSGVSANPALGYAADRLIALGGTVLLSETPEIHGAEHLLYARAESPHVADLLRSRIGWWTRYMRRNGAELDNNPSPGNKAGGLTTIIEKSLGAVAKSGTSPLVDVIGYGEPVRRSGLTFMDSPGYDPCSATGQVASGANLLAFTTGRGSVFGFKPTPSIKIASNTDVALRMQGDMDIDCGSILRGEATITEVGKRILDYLLEIASGVPSRSETLGYGGTEFVPWIVGATM